MIEKDIIRAAARSKIIEVCKEYEVGTLQESLLKKRNFERLVDGIHTVMNDTAVKLALRGKTWSKRAVIKSIDNLAEVYVSRSFQKIKGDNNHSQFEV